jgi:hypothetical protein
MQLLYQLVFTMLFLEEVNKAKMRISGVMCADVAGGNSCLLSSCFLL